VARKGRNGTSDSFSGEDDGIAPLDATNRKIVDLMIAKPKITQVEVARILGMSQSSIAVRIEKLRKNQLINQFVGLNLEQLGLRMSRVDVSTSDVDALLQWARHCPLFVNSSVGIGGENVSLLFVSEDMEMFHYIIEHHVRRIQGVTNLKFVPILKWQKVDYFPLLLDVPKRKTPPCGVLPYCPRCPANPEYDGSLWRDGKGNE
jgi:DNA-binding Lrp family transcriptional regulator